MNKKKLALILSSTGLITAAATVAPLIVSCSNNNSNNKYTSPINNFPVIEPNNVNADTSIPYAIGYYHALFQYAVNFLGSIDSGDSIEEFVRYWFDDMQNETVKIALTQNNTKAITPRKFYEIFKVIANCPTGNCTNEMEQYYPSKNTTLPNLFYKVEGNKITVNFENTSNLVVNLQNGRIVWAMMYAIQFAWEDDPNAPETTDGSKPPQIFNKVRSKEIWNNTLNELQKVIVRINEMFTINESGFVLEYPVNNQKPSNPKVANRKNDLIDY